MNRFLVSSRIFRQILPVKCPAQANHIRPFASGRPPKPPVADAETIFDKIIRKQIPADIIYEDDKCLAFNDVLPQGPVHFLVIPKQRIPKLEDGTVKDVETFGHLMQIAGQLGKQKAPNGFRLVINNGDHGCQTVHHLHLHIIGGRQLSWPPG
ncbi:uncharacterized HIT-like protein Synpcc7942_1390 [Toxorhynchites rutilus septentrionalis]|uniref:uncharacterized HIT-like protein Synpcc7942_1390 n=1 Tax=Toxorhynchites rutilus septentrionalis TaxID=329112 RepID=UPI002479A603|nr:uncharacterized HIT-like protein Synpcc7942_1390 [Toxorhynchites rutilus septentrionalis]